MGCPIRISTDHFVCADPRSFSQLITSFIASGSLGIPHTPLFTSNVQLFRLMCSCFSSYSMSMNFVTRTPSTPIHCLLVVYSCYLVRSKCLWSNLLWFNQKSLCPSGASMLCPTRWLSFFYFISYIKHLTFDIQYLIRLRQGYGGQWWRITDSNR